MRRIGRGRDLLARHTTEPQEPYVTTTIASGGDPGEVEARLRGTGRRDHHVEPSMRTIFTLAIALLATACLGSDFGDSLEGSWQLTSGAVDGKEIPLTDTHPITLIFDGEDVGGTASCNGYGGTFELSGSTIRFGDLALTEMACMPEETMQAEALYSRALAVVTTVVLDDHLTLAGPGVELEFEMLPAVPQAELTNTVWVLDGLVTGDAVSSVSGERATIEFFSDGSVLGSTGCRLLTGHYVVNGAEVVMTDLSAEGLECHPDLARQDDHIISVIEGTMRVDVAGNRLTVTAAGGDGLAYVADE